jgi:hypothetical protein
MFVARKPAHIKETNHKLNKYCECRMKDRDDGNEKLVNKKNKLLKAQEAIKFPVSVYIYFFILGIFIHTNTLLKLEVTHILLNYIFKN